MAMLLATPASPSIWSLFNPKTELPLRNTSQLGSIPHILSTNSAAVATVFVQVVCVCLLDTDFMFSNISYILPCKDVAPPMLPAELQVAGGV